jgi:anaerobic ribonucleoside-triphosphate reductase activating protein
MDFNDQVQEKLITHIAHCPIITGVTLTGGDPMFSAVDVLRFVLRLRERVPNISIWLYTGFIFEELTSAEHQLLLEHCDVLVDGRFEQDKLDQSLLFRGSTNQRIIDLVATRSEGKITLWKG